MVSLKTAQIEKAHDDVTKALNDKETTTDNLLRVYAAHSSTTAPDLSTVDNYGRHVQNPVKARNLVEVINTVRSHIAYYPETAAELKPTVQYTRQLVDDKREYCLVNYDTYQVEDSSDEAVRETLSNYQLDLKRQLDLSYGIDRDDVQVTSPESDLELSAE